MTLPTRSNTPIAHTEDIGLNYPTGEKKKKKKKKKRKEKKRKKKEKN